jgi:hypothetical protein
MSVDRLQHFLLLEEGSTHGQSDEVGVFFVSEAFWPGWAL